MQTWTQLAEWMMDAQVGGWVQQDFGRVGEVLAGLGRVGKVGQGW